MPRPRLSLPPEIIDYTIDLLHNDTEALSQCCLVSKAWIHRTRRYLFREIKFLGLSKLEAWKKFFPDPASSPAHYARLLLLFACTVTTKDAEEGGWIRSFTDVTELELWSMDTSLQPFYALSSVKSLRVLRVTSREVPRLVCSLPLLEDLDISTELPRIHDDDQIAFLPPSTLPPLTGTLVLKRRVMRTACQLLDLPGDLRFRKIAWETSFSEGELELVTDLIEKCSHTLEGIFVKTYGLGKRYLFGSYGQLLV